MSMTTEELGLELRRMVEDGEKHGEKKAMLVLFGIKYAEQLSADRGRVAAVIKVAFGETPSWVTEINIGRQLAKYVTPR